MQCDCSALALQLALEYEDLQRANAAYSTEVTDLRAENEALQRDLVDERSRNNVLESGTEQLRGELSSMREQLSNAEAAAAVRRIDHLKGLAEDAVDAEAARGRELASRLEAALRESREREAAANARAEMAAAAQSAEAERRARQLRLQLEQLRDAAAARDREATEAMRNQKLAEKQAQIAADSEDRLRLRIADLEPRIEEMRSVAAERDTLSVKADQLSQLAEAQVRDSCFLVMGCSPTPPCAWPLSSFGADVHSRALVPAAGPAAVTHPAPDSSCGSHKWLDSRSCCFGFRIDAVVAVVAASLMAPAVTPAVTPRVWECHVALAGHRAAAVAGGQGQGQSDRRRAAPPARD